MKLRDLIYPAVIGALLMCIFATSNLFSRRAAASSAAIRVDTLVVRDTLRDTILVPHLVRVIRVDTVWLHDTVRVALPIEQKTYQTDDYRVVIEGFRPSLVELELYPRTLHINTIRTAPPKRWAIGLQAGVGLAKTGSTPYVGVGVQYNLIRF